MDNIGQQENSLGGECACVEADSVNPTFSMLHDKAMRFTSKIAKMDTKCFATVKSK